MSVYKIVVGGPEEIGVDRRIILKLKLGLEGVDWIGLSQVEVHWWAVCSLCLTKTEKISVF